MAAPGSATRTASGGGYLYSHGRYTALGTLNGLPTDQYGINDRDEIVLPAAGTLVKARRTG